MTGVARATADGNKKQDIKNKITRTVNIVTENSSAPLAINLARH